MTRDILHTNPSYRSTTDRLLQPAAAYRAAGSFDEVVVPHLDAAYRLARSLMRNVYDAEDAVQDASLRALRYFHTFTGGSGRRWFLRIVRNSCYARCGQRLNPPPYPFDEEQHSGARLAVDPETSALQADDARLVDGAIRSLPARSRKLLVLRELEGLSYRELADVLGIPLGTVMSSLARARGAFRHAMRHSMVPEPGR